MNPASLIGWIHTYLEAATLLSLSWVALALSFTAIKRLGLQARFADLAKFGKGLILASLLIPLLMLATPKHTLLRPAVQVWSGISKKHQPRYALLSLTNTPLSEEASSDLHGWIVRERLAFTLMALAFAGVFIRLSFFGFSLFRLHRFLRGLPCMRKLGHVSVLATECIDSPFSTWTLGSAMIVLPIDLVAQPQNMRIALKHELQHHRAGDTRWLYVLEFLKALFFWNPWVYALSSTLSQIQEFACDEFLIGHRKISTHAYGHCLLQVAQSAIQPRRIWAGTARMSGKMESSHLKRRVEMLFRYRSSGSSRALVLIALGTFSLMASLAYASRSAIQDRAITLAEAKTYAQVASSIPLNVNELVVEKLNRFVGTPEGRTFLRNAFDRLPQYQSMIEKKARAYGLPEELVAIAMFESGLQNDAVSPAPYRAAGLWQFVPETARRYGLTVNATQDERLQSEKETDAAMSYLRDLYNIFQDWRLALKAYNEGESRVLQLIEQYKTRDAWELERASTRESYLSGATAMLIIYKNPSLMK